RYEVRGCKKMGSYVVAVKMERDAGFLGRKITVSDTPGYEPVTADIRVPRGVVVTVRLIDAGTGKPVPGEAAVHVLADNTFIGRGSKFEGTEEYAYHHTGPDGSVRLVSVPGRVLLDGKVNANEFKYKLAMTDPKYPQYFPTDPRELGIFFSPNSSRTIMQGQH